MKNKNKIVLIIIILIVIISACVIFIKFNDKKKNNNDNLSVNEKYIKEFRKIREDVISNLSTYKTATCSNNEECSKIYEYDTNDLIMTVTPFEGYVQLQLITKDSGKYKDALLKQEDCNAFLNIVCGDGIINQNLINNY